MLISFSVSVEKLDNQVIAQYKLELLIHCMEVLVIKSIYITLKI